MRVKYKRLLLFVVFYVTGRHNTGHGTQEKQTSISSRSNKVSELRWISATCCSHEIASPLTIWPQYQATPYQSPFSSREPKENAGLQGGLRVYPLAGVSQCASPCRARWRGLPGTMEQAAAEGMLKLQPHLKMLMQHGWLPPALPTPSHCCCLGSTARY